jgi:hypothetical protein
MGEYLKGDFMKKLLLAIICVLVLSWAGPAGACDPKSLTRLMNTNSCPLCDLSGCMLARQDLRGTRLWRANLEGANLEGANLDASILVGANLKGANLSGATLIGADLLNADLKGANLSGSGLSSARWVDGKKCSYFSADKCK